CLSLIAQPPLPLHSFFPLHEALASAESVTATFLPSAAALSPPQPFLPLHPDFSVLAAPWAFLAPSAWAGAAETRPAAMPANASWASIEVFFMVILSATPGRGCSWQKLQSPGIGPCRRVFTGKDKGWIGGA